MMGDPKKDRGRGFNMGAIGSLTHISWVFFLFHFTQIWNHHPDYLALCRTLV